MDECPQYYVGILYNIILYNCTVAVVFTHLYDESWKTGCGCTSGATYSADEERGV